MKKILAFALALVMMLAVASAEIGIFDSEGNLFAGTNENYGDAYTDGKQLPKLGDDVGAANVIIAVAPIEGLESNYAHTTYGYYNPKTAKQVEVGAFWVAGEAVVFDPSFNDSEYVWYVQNWYQVGWDDVNDQPILAALETEKFFVNWNTDGYVSVTGRSWYPNNHAHAFQKLSQKYDGWKTYANVDLSTDGTQTIKLVAAGAWNIGNITVTVNGDEVVVDYMMHEDKITVDVWDDVNVDSEFINIFADADSIDLEAESTFAFGVPFSIANDLGGDTEVALVIELVVDFTENNPYVYREWTGMNK